MRRKKINPINVAFLDLLSGALGAVIILFIVIPKAKSPQPTDAPVAQIKPLEDASLMKKLFKKSIDAEDKMGQVKAGLKMLITSMGEEFDINIIHFPGIGAPFTVLWQNMQPITTENKKSAYHFLHNLAPHGNTPTFQALFYALDRYRDASDIVLLSDGAPTDRNMIPKLRNYNTVYDAIKYHNYNRIQINTIGVGSDFFKDTKNDRYKFLSKVAGANDGFFVGF